VKTHLKIRPNLNSFPCSFAQNCLPIAKMIYIGPYSRHCAIKISSSNPELLIVLCLCWFVLQTHSFVLNPFQSFTSGGARDILNTNIEYRIRKKSVRAAKVLFTLCAVFVTAPDRAILCHYMFEYIITMHLLLLGILINIACLIHYIFM